jgi:hypothetical protein
MIVAVEAGLGVSDASGSAGEVRISDSVQPASATIAMQKNKQSFFTIPSL